MSSRGSWFRTAIALLLWVGLGGAAQADDFRVMATIKPIHSILAGLMQGTEGPQLLIDDGSPYSFTPSEAQLHDMAQADLLFWVGPELEAGLADSVRSLSPEVRVVELLADPAMKILPSRSDPDVRDPYFWLDNRNVLILLDDMTRLLQDADPQRAHVYTRNRREILERLSRIDREYEYGYRGMKAGLGVQYYDTLQYFEQAYALKVLDHVAGSPLQTVNAAALLKVRERLNSGEAVCLLTEKGLPAEHLSLLMQGSGANQGQLNSLGVGMQPGPDLYFDMMDYNTDTIKRCLNADMELASQARAEAEATAGEVVDGIGDGQFLLTDHLGGVVSKEDMLGKYQVLYFGYTYCPDVCPLSLQVLFMALNQMDQEKAAKIQPYFITVDPGRDTVAVMRDYVQYFDGRLIGLTGSPEMIRRVAAQYKVRYEKVEEEGGDPDLYLMDHSASIYLLDPEGRFITKFAHGIPPAELAKRLNESVR